MKLRGKRANKRGLLLAVTPTLGNGLLKRFRFPCLLYIPDIVYGHRGHYLYVFGNGDTACILIVRVKSRSCWSSLAIVLYCTVKTKVLIKKQRQSRIYTYMYMHV